MIRQGLIFLLLTVLIIMGSDTAWPQVVERNQCLLTYMPSGRSSVAVSLVQSACNFLSDQFSTWDLHRDERLYNECLLLNLGNVDNDNAAYLIRRACYDRYLDRFRLR
jgi:hypothetical protein